MKDIKRIIQSSALKQFLLLLFLFILFTIISAFSYVNAITAGLSNNLFRLHVVANSNSYEDQLLKYLVRDNILQYIDKNSGSLNNVGQVIHFVENNIEEIRTIAQNTIYDNGYDYPITARIGNFRFPTKHYGDISFPPGFYNALKVEIGSSSGNNWWCVMFPPLCFVDVSSGIVPDSSREIMRENLLNEEYRLISDSSTEIRVRFKMVEMVQNIATRN